jgi:protein tyrosine/serine phosphatase
VTRFGAVVRADSIRQLTAGGWESLLAYGVRTIVDLRLESERQEDPPHPPSVGIVHVPLGDEVGTKERADFDDFIRRTDDVARIYEALYGGLLERFGPGIASAVCAVGRSPAGGVLVHCYAGKDRTGLVCALLLRLVGVPHDQIAADYALSATNLAPLMEEWLAETDDEAERVFRRRISTSPPEAMQSVVAELERRHGSVERYLLEAGAGEGDLDRARARLLGRAWL